MGKYKPIPSTKTSPENDNRINYIAYFCLILFVLLVPFFPDEKLVRLKLLSLQTLLFFTAIFTAADMVYKKKVVLTSVPVNLPIFLYLSYIGIHYAVSQDKPTAMTELTRNILSAIIFFTAARVVDSYKKVKLLVTAWTISAVILAVYGIAQHYGGFMIMPKVKFDVPQMDRIMSTFGNPIFFAVFLVTTLPLSIAAAFTAKKLFTRILFIFCVVVLLIALYFTYTRAAWIAAGAALVVFAFVLIRTLRARIMFLVIATVLLGVFAFSTRTVWLRFQEHPLIWRDTVVMWTKHPIAGIGLGTFHLYFPKHASAELKKIFPQERFIVNDAHNEYLQILAETGVIGFILFFAIICSYYLFLHKIFTQKVGHTGEQRVWLSAIAGSVTAVFVQNIFSVDMRFIISSVYLYLVMGITAGIGCANKETVLVKMPMAWQRGIASAIILFTAYYSAGMVLKPYFAQRKLAQTPDFFEQKLNNPETQLAELQQLAVEHPADPRVHEKIGWVYAKQKMFTQAIDAYEKSLKIQPSHGVFNNMGNVYFLALNNKDMAIKCYQESLKLSPHQVDARLNLGVAFYYKGMLKEAADQFKKVLEIDPNNEKAIIYYKKMVE
ncbi:MAG: tetratricopeptide repeat protein [Elusimicrobiota bacterium]